jgi:hypothetical protein
VTAPDRSRVPARVEQGPGAFLLVPRNGVAMESLGPLADALRTVRDRRPRPAVDAKSITGWNALMIEALARSGRLLGRTADLESPVRTMKRLLALNTTDRRVHRYSIDGGARLDGPLEDVALLLRALGVLHELDGDGFWIAQAPLIVAALPPESRLAEALRAAGHDRAAAAATLGEALHRLARQTGAAPYRDALADVAGPLREADPHADRRRRGLGARRRHLPDGPRDRSRLRRSARRGLRGNRRGDGPPGRPRHGLAALAAGVQRPAVSSSADRPIVSLVWSSPHQGG